MRVSSLGRRQLGTLSVSLVADGEIAVSVSTDGGSRSMVDLPNAPLLAEGVVVEVTGGATSELDARAWGYLVDA